VSRKEKTGVRWEPIAAIASAIFLWISGFDRRWFAFGPWSKGFPDWYPPGHIEFLTGVVVTALGLAWCFSSVRYAGRFSKSVGVLGFIYFYLHVITLGYMSDPSLFIWKFFPGAK
jgi:hypothetical protein